MTIAVFDIGGSAVKYGLFKEEQLSHVNQFVTQNNFNEMQKKK